MDVIQIGFPTTFQPYLSRETSSKEIIDNCYEKLVRYDGRKVVPCLADEWISISSTSVLFHIRENVLFHSGNHVTPESVVKSLIHSLNSDNEYMVPVKQIISNVSCARNGTIRIDLNQPCSFLLHLLAIHCFSIVEDWNDDPYYIPSGTGPYYISQYDIEKEIRLSFFSDYWNVRPQIEDVRISYIDSVEIRKELLFKNAADIVHCNFNLPECKNDYYQEIQNLSCDNFVLGFNFRHEIFQVKDIRLAFSYAFPYEEYLTRLKEKYYPLRGIIPFAMLETGERMESMRTDLEYATRLLAPYRDEIHDIILINCKGLYYRRLGLDLYCKNLEKIGIRAYIIEQTWRDFLKYLELGKFDIAYISYAPDYGDPQCFVDSMLSQSGGIAKELGLQSASLTSICNKTALIQDYNQRIDSIKRINNLVIEDAIYIGLLQGIDTKVISKRLHGMKYSPYLGDYYFYDMYIKE